MIILIRLDNLFSYFCYAKYANTTFSKNVKLAAAAIKERSREDASRPREDASNLVIRNENAVDANNNKTSSIDRSGGSRLMMHHSNNRCACVL